MKNRRLALIAGLGVVELWIVGMMIHSVHGNSRGRGLTLPATHLSAGSPAEAATSGNRTEKTLETGPVPHVVIDDDDATLNVSVRAGTTVAVSEETLTGGWMQANGHRLSVEKTADGVRIARPDAGFVVFMGEMRRRLDVVVPPGTRLDVDNAGASTISGLRAAATVHTDEGSIALSDLRGTVEAKTDNGRIELTDVEAPSLDLTSDNGHIVLDRVRADSVAIETDNGRIEVGRSVLRGGTVKSDSGRIRLGLDGQSNVTISAHTSSGKVTAQAPLSAVRGDGDDAPSAIRVGSGAGKLDVGSDDGSITVLGGDKNVL